jgi:ABC-type multidrug transport system fused ATPase/permease subunit
MANWLVRTAAEAEQNMTSVERVTHYVDNTAGEAYAPPPGAAAPPPGWPATGALAYANFTMRYREETPEVLKGVTFDVRAGERVGIVGRTGSGKSSVLVSLFRLIEQKCTAGSVALDGVDTCSVGLKQLRSALAIIPQDPTVFSGTLRANLDPTESLGPGGGPAPDAALWAALEKVGLKEWAARLEGGLDAPVAEFGESMSLGQRQLVCLCRVLLRADRVSLLALDEASASLDHVSDAALQAALRESFSHATHLVVAHRLHTIIHCDRILVLDGGAVAEFDHPHALLEKTGSIFAGLVEELGAANAASLRATAKENFERSKGGTA